MSITYRFTTKPGIFTQENEVLELMRYLGESIKRHTLNFSTFALSEIANVNVTSNDNDIFNITLTFPTAGIMNSAEGHYRGRAMEAFVEEIGIASLIEVQGINWQTLSTNNIDIKLSEIEQITRNHSLLKSFGVGDDEIPEKYLCALTAVLIDEPVYFKQRPNTKFEEKHLKNWLFKESKMIDPFNRQPVSFSDIVHDRNLKDEIDSYKCTVIKKMSAATKAKKLHDLEELCEFYSDKKPWQQKIVFWNQASSPKIDNLFVDEESSSYKKCR